MWWNCFSIFQLLILNFSFATPVIPQNVLLPECCYISCMWWQKNKWLLAFLGWFYTYTKLSIIVWCNIAINNITRFAFFFCSAVLQQSAILGFFQHWWKGKNVGWYAAKNLDKNEKKSRDSFFLINCQCILSHWWFGLFWKTISNCH